MGTETSASVGSTPEETVSDGKQGGTTTGTGSDTSTDTDFETADEPMVITGVNLVEANYDNSRLRCDFSKKSPAVYDIYCNVVALLPTGEELLATSVARGTTLAFLPAVVLEGVPESVDCESSSPLRNTCRVSLADGAALARLKFDLRIGKTAMPAVSRTEVSIVTLPYAVGVAAGFSPFAPFHYASADAAKGGLGLAEPPPAPEKVGLQLVSTPAEELPLMSIGPMCRSGDSLFFVGGSAVFRLRGGRVELFAGSFNPEHDGTSDHRYRTRMPVARIACHEGGVYVTQRTLNRILRIREEGPVELVAGTGDAASSSDGLIAKAAAVDGPIAIAVMPDGRVLFGESSGTRLRVIEKDGTLGTIAGDGTPASAGDGGLARDAQVAGVDSLTVAPDESVYFSESMSHVVRRLALVDGKYRISRVAGTGHARFDFPEDALALSDPKAVAVDADGTVFVAEKFRGVKRVGPGGTLTEVIPGATFEGSGVAILQTPDQTDDLAIAGKPVFDGLMIDGGRLFADWEGKGAARYDRDGKVEAVIIGGPEKPSLCATPVEGKLARLIMAPTVSFGPDGNIYFPDRIAYGLGRLVVRKLYAQEDTTMMQTLHGCTSEHQVHTANVAFGTSAIAINDLGHVLANADGSVLLSNYSQNLLVRISPQGDVSPVAGTGTAGFAVDGSVAATSAIAAPLGMAQGPDGTLYFAEFGTGLVRKIGTDGRLTTVVGQPGDASFAGDGGPAVAARAGVNSLAVGPDGTIYLADFLNNRIRRVDPVTGIINTIAGTGAFGYQEAADDARTAPLWYPSSIAVDNKGVVYFTDFGNQRVARLTRVPGSTDPDAYALTNFFGRSTTPTDCGIGKVSGRAAVDEVGDVVNASLSMLCTGVMRGVAVQDTCPAADGKTRIAISQSFHDYANVVTVEVPCASSP